MKLFKALSSINKLNKKQKEFVRLKKIEDKRKLKAWLDFLNQIAEYDTYGDKARKELIIMLFIFGFLSFFLVGIPFFVIVLILYLRLHRDINNTLRSFLHPLLLIIREETNEKNRMSIEMDMNKGIGKAYFQNKVKVSPRPRGVRSRTHYYYYIQRIEANVKILNGVELSFKLSDKIRKAKITKISTSGKLKTKTKYKIKNECKIIIFFPKNRFKKVTEDTTFLTEDAKNYIFTKKDQNISREKEAVYPLKNFLGIIGTAYKQFQPIAKA